MVHDLQTHALPDQQKELERCAIRMGYDKADRPIAVKQFQPTIPPTLPSCMTSFGHSSKRRRPRRFSKTFQLIGERR